MEPTYQVIFRGKLLSGFTPETVCSNVATLFRTDPARIAAMLKQPKLVLKTGVNKATAQQYQEALRQAGMMVAVMADEPVSGIPAAAPAPEPPQAAADAPLDPTPPAPKLQIDTSHLSLAEVGAVIGRPPPRHAPVVAPASFNLAAPGTVLIEAKPVPKRVVDTSALSLAPVKIEEKPLSALVREAG